MPYKTKKIAEKRKKSLILWVVLNFAIVTIFSATLVLASDITTDTVIKLVNNARAKINVVVLKKNDLLQKAAEEKANDMIENNYFAHISPQGKSPWDWIKQSGYDYSYAGENLAINFKNAEDEQKAWMDSASHRKNILNPNYEDTGVAVKQGVIDGQETIVVVQMFGKQMQKAIASAEVINNKKEANASVAGAITNNTGSSSINLVNMENSSKAQKFSDQMNLNVLFENNAPTLIGWFSIFGLAIMIILIDVAALIHKKHKPFFLEHKTHSA